MRIVCKAAACAGRPCCRAVYCTLPNSHANERPTSVRGRGEGSRAYAQRTKEIRSTLSARVRPSAHAGAAVVAPAWRHEPPLRRRNYNPLPCDASVCPRAAARPRRIGHVRIPASRRYTFRHVQPSRLWQPLRERAQEAVCSDGRTGGRCGEGRLGGRHYRPCRTCGTEAGPVWVACRQHIHRRRVQALDPLVHRAVHADHGRQREPGHAVAFRH